MQIKLDQGLHEFSMFLVTGEKRNSVFSLFLVSCVFLAFYTIKHKENVKIMSTASCLASTKTGQQFSIQRATFRFSNCHCTFLIGEERRGEAKAIK